jgi:hypothetical protein
VGTFLLHDLLVLFQLFGFEFLCLILGFAGIFTLIVADLEIDDVHFLLSLFDLGFLAWFLGEDVSQSI